MPNTETPVDFKSLGLNNDLLKALEEIGYEQPSPIQAEMIPHVLAGSDVIGQAQTGTGKTAAFALPLLHGIDIKQKNVQVLVLTPTRELAIQVAEAFQQYAHFSQGFHVLPVYGGQDYNIQLKQLRRGVQVVVGTPGRVMDHMRRKTLDLSKLNCMVLDEADEMLRMGFIDDVEWILEQTPEQRQVALFSATMPREISRIAQKYLNKPVEISIKEKTTTAKTIRQRYWPVSGMHKLDALTRILEAEPTDGVIIFVRTKNSTVELAEKLEARGYASSAINGDLVQKQRKATIERLKNGRLDILIATDVAARGLDVSRISHVINYDIPHDTEAYTHRIGRTGRAGRSGEAILFVAPREKRMLGSIERATRQKIELMELPSTETINDQRIANFKQKITDTLSNENLEFFQGLIEQYEQEHNIPAIEIAAALAKMGQGDVPLLLKRPKRSERRDIQKREYEGRKERGFGGNREDSRRGERNRDYDKPRAPKPLESGLERYRVAVGHNDAVKPGNIVGAIANEGGLDAKDIGHIAIFEDYSTVDLPKGMPKDVFSHLKNKVWVCNKKLDLSKLADNQQSSEPQSRKRKPAPRRSAAPVKEAANSATPATKKPKKTKKERARKAKKIAKKSS